MDTAAAAETAAGGVSGATAAGAGAGRGAIARGAGVGRGVGKSAACPDAARGQRCAESGPFSRRRSLVAGDDSGQILLDVALGSRKRKESGSEYTSALESLLFLDAGISPIAVALFSLNELASCCNYIL